VLLKKADVIQYPDSLLEFTVGNFMFIARSMVKKGNLGKGRDCVWLR
jgi:hypothetical protein